MDSTGTHNPLDLVRVTSAPNPFTNLREQHRLAAGQTIAQILGTIQPDPWLRQQSHVYADGREIPPEQWDAVPEPGSLLVIRAFPGGGRGGGGKIFRSILMIFVAIAAVAVGTLLPGALGLTGTVLGGILGAMGGVATGVVGNLLVNALIPPARIAPKSESASPGLTGVTSYSLNGSQNQSGKWGTIPRLFGTLRVMPLKAAEDFSEILGDDQYVRCLFTCGYGPVEISDLKIGDTAISEYAGIETEYRNLVYDGTTYGNEAHTLYTRDVHEEALSIKLEHLEEAIRTSQPGATFITVDITAPKGIVNENPVYGFNQGWAIRFKIYYREHGTSDPWTMVESFGSWMMTINTWRRSFEIKDINPARDPLKQYDIRILNETNKAIYSTQVWDLYWTALRSWKDQSPVNFPQPLATMAIRVKASDELNGTISTFSCLASSILPDWDSTTQTWITRVTNNPASCFLQVLTGAENPKALAESRLDLEKIQEWHEYCTAKGYAYNKMIDAKVPIYSLLAEIAAAGRASISQYDSKWSVIMDEEQLAPAQIFTPRNSYGMEVSLLYPDLPHGFRVQFINEQNDYQEDERFVLDDAYQVEDYDAWGQYHPEYAQANIFEQLDLPGVTDPDNVFKLARYHIAAARLRPRVITFKTDFEHLAVTRGDLIHLAHDVMLVGVGSGRLKTLVLNDSGDLTGFITDDFFAAVSGTSYTARFRIADNSAITLTARVTPIIDADAFETDRYTLDDPILAGATMPAAGDLVLIGEVDQESIPLVIKSIQTGPDLAATLTCVDYAPEINSADAGNIPAFNPQITLPALWLPPVVDYIGSDLTAAVQTVSGPQIAMQINVVARSGVWQKNANMLQVQYWPKNSPNEKVTINSTNLNRVSIYPVDTGVYYQFQLRYTGYDGLYTAWSEVYEHKAVGLSDLPEVTNLVDLYRDNQVILHWDSLFDPALGWPNICYEVRRGSDWATAEIVGAVKDTSFTVPGSGDYWVAVRVQNQYSDPTGITITGANLSENVVFTNDEYADGWLGAMTDVIVDGSGYLELAGAGLFDGIPDVDAVTDIDTEGGLVSEGYYETADEVDLGDVQPAKVYAVIDSISNDLFNDFDAYPDIDMVSNVDGEISAYTQVVVQIALADAGGTYGDWKNFYPGTYNARKIKLRLQLTTSDLYITPLVQAFSWTVDMPDRIESDTVDLGSGGATISYSRDFQMTPAPQVTIYNATAGDEVFITAKDASGFTVQVKNGGSGVARTIHWIAKGY